MSELLKQGAEAAAPAAAAKQEVGTPGRQTLPELHGDGQPLPDATRTRYERTLGVSLSDVRVHTGGSASAAADAVDAKAYTKGNDIVFGAGHDPADPKSQRLLQHELAHVVQQRGAPAAAGPLATTQPGDGAEREADAAAESMAAGTPASVSAQPQTIAREKKGEDKPETKTENDPASTEPDTVLTFNESWFKASPFALEKSGGVEVDDLGDKVHIGSPEIIATSTATLDLPKDQTLEGVKGKGGRFVHVGPIQTLMSSNRVGIYRKDGKTTESAMKMGQVRDVAPVTYDVAAKSFGQEGPFYSGNPDVAAHKENKTKAPENKDRKGEAPTSELGNFSGKGTHFETQVVMIDKPGFTLPKQMPDGAKLVGTKGSDEFNTSAGFRTDTGQNIAKSAFGWRVSWNKEINTEKSQDEQKKDKAKGKKEADAITSFEVAEPVIDDTSAFAVALGAIKSVDDAMSKPADWLFKSLARARTAYPEAVPFMEQALGQQKITVTILPTKTATGATSEGTKLNFNVTASMHKQGRTGQTTGVIREAKDTTYTFSDIANPAACQGTETVGVAVNEWENGIFSPTHFLGGATNVAIGGSGTVSDGDSVVQVSVNWGTGGGGKKK